MEYIKRFRDRSLKIREDVTEERLIRIYAEGLLDEYRVHLINVAHDTFRKFVEKARNIGPSVHRRFNAISILTWTGGSSQNDSEHHMGARRQQLTMSMVKEIPTNNKGTTGRISPALPYEVDEAMDIYMNLVKHEVFKTRPNRRREAGPKLLPDP